MFKLFLSPKGRVDRREFWIGVIPLAVLIFGFNFFLPKLGKSMIAFFLPFPFLFLIIQMTYSIYGKRLHDMGRSVWPLTGMIVLAFVIVPIVVMLTFGGSELFADFSQYDRKSEIDPDVQKAIQDRYQARLKEGVPYLPHLVASVIAAFTLWVGLSKSDRGDNKYGHA